mmetsp:Transcript_8774/g.12172  ORF Transcript_8774/g.12172 Transcript_8774/m.12172 type:complete len:296 (+) Transcript_8774:438-1325(+)
MEDICTTGSNIRTFLESFPGSLGEICGNEYRFFEPSREKASILRTWLSYRCWRRRRMVLEDLSHEVLVREAKRDMTRDSGAPPFAGFTDFSPKEVTTEFMILWLSWYGVTSIRSRKRSWWKSKTSMVQRSVSRSRRLTRRGGRRLLHQARLLAQVSRDLDESLRDIGAALEEGRVIGLPSAARRFSSFAREETIADRIGRRLFSNGVVRSDTAFEPVVIRGESGDSDRLVFKRSGVPARFARNLRNQTIAIAVEESGRQAWRLVENHTRNGVARRFLRPIVERIILPAITLTFAG